MPLYEYECTRCNHRFELLQSFSDKPRKRCPECRGKVERLIGAPAIRFKGSGWYVTDYAKKGASPEGKEGDKPSKDKEQGTKKPSEGTGKSRKTTKDEAAA